MGGFGGGVAELLDELLAEGGGQEPPYVLPAAADSTSGGSQTVSPRSPQISELCAEMDSCLASLGRWEEESRARVESIRKDLEAHDGFPGKEWNLQDADDTEDPVGEAYCLALSAPCAAAPGSRLAASPAPTPLAAPGGAAAAGLWLPLDGALPEDSASLLSADDLRIAQLRLEVEQLQRNEFQQQDSQSMISADDMRIAQLRSEVEQMQRNELLQQQEIFQSFLDADGLVGDGTSALELTRLCLEVDSLFEAGNLNDCRTDFCRSRHSSPGLEQLDSRLQEVHTGLAQMEGALTSARSGLDFELSELDMLFSDRDIGAPRPNLSARGGG